MFTTEFVGLSELHILHIKMFTTELVGLRELHILHCINIVCNESVSLRIFIKFDLTFM